MKPSWLIEDFHHENAFTSLAEAVRRAGMKCTVAQYLPFESGRYDVYPPDACVVFQGSIQMAKQIQREQKWIPGVWASWENYRCSRYYVFLGEHLLIGSHYMMMPLAEVNRRREELFAHYDGAFFIRPDTGAKSFTGTVVKWDERNPNIEFFGSSPEELVVIGPNREITREWRIAVAGRTAITGSLYHARGKHIVMAGAPADAMKLAETVAAAFQPDRLFIVDVCEAGGQLYLLELGAFSVAGLYAMNPDLLVEAASAEAIHEWVDINL